MAGALGSSQWMHAHFDPKRMPVEAVNYLQLHRVNAPILSPDYWGGYLIYRLYSSYEVVIDDRHDFYGEQFLKSYLKMVHVEPGWNDFLKLAPCQLPAAAEKCGAYDCHKRDSGMEVSLFG